MKRDQLALRRVKRQMAGVFLLAMGLSLLLYLCREEAGHNLQELVWFVCYDLLHIPLDA